jgi:hypothetical protein
MSAEHHWYGERRAASYGLEAMTGQSLPEIEVKKTDRQLALQEAYAAHQLHPR